MIIEGLFGVTFPEWTTVPSSMAVTLLFMIILISRFAKDATPQASLGAVLRNTLRKTVFVICTILFILCSITFYHAQYYGGQTSVDLVYVTMLSVFLMSVGMSYYMGLKEIKGKRLTYRKILIFLFDCKTKKSTCFNIVILWFNSWFIFIYGTLENS